MKKTTMTTTGKTTTKATKSKEDKVMVKKEVEKKEVANIEKKSIGWEDINALWTEYGIKAHNPNTKGYRVMGTEKGGTSLHISRGEYILLSTKIDWEAAVTKKIEGVEYIEGGNSVDKVRPHKVIAKTEEQFRELLKLYATNPFNMISAQ